MSSHSDQPPIPATLVRTWSERGVSVEALAHAGVRTTIRGVEVTDAELTQPPSVDEGAAALAVDHEVLLGSILGEGGMGVVHEARQRSLDRDVAVKRLRAEGTRSSNAAARLLREARITGGLEHPNVVPIHLLGHDAAGQPLIVMKRVEGRAWSEILSARAREERLSEDTLRRHLAILVSVARATHFAHTRGVLHRDIKPDNVMVGGFGEVYLVDWGLAVRLELAANIRQIEGTPVYMAPEMAAADGPRIDARTDVYLLGATLHEIVTGSPPHVAESAGAAVARAFASEIPADAADVPRALWQIVRRAMARERDDRFATVAEFADALESFLVRRGSHLLAEAASARASRLEVRGQDPAPSMQSLRATFQEARFAFEQSLAHWADNDDARRGLRAATTAMIRLELTSGAPDVAEALLPLLDPPNAELDLDVRRAVADARARAKALEAAARDADLTIGARGRRALNYLAAITWGASLVGAGFTTRTGILPVDHVRFALINAGFFVGTLVAMGLTREITLTNAASRRVLATTLLVFAAGVILWPVFGHVGLTMAESTVVGALVSALLWSSAVLSLGAPWIPMVVGQSSVAILASIWPAYHFEIFGVLGGIQTAIAGTLMSRGRATAT